MGGSAKREMGAVLKGSLGMAAGRGDHLQAGRLQVIKPACRSVTLRQRIFCEIAAQRKEVLLNVWRMQVKLGGSAGAVFGKGC